MDKLMCGGNDGWMGGESWVGGKGLEWMEGTTGQSSRSGMMGEGNHD